ncbi:MAG: DM13 domain-containing protein [Chloroflexi bacterium]|nr:DM13 domain-containing protein [Chloroflexota bacterium]
MIFGDIERALAQLYPYRVPIAIGLAAIGVALAVMAYRRHWFEIVRRHPRGSLVGAVATLVIGLPVAWILVSPLFIRTQLDEASPLLVASAPAPPGLSTPGPSAQDQVAILPPTDSPASDTAESPRTVAGGTFTGADDFHFGTGKALLVETAPGTFVLRFEEFSVQNGPDLFVYLSPSIDGYADGSVELGTLKATDGAFNYEIPAGIDVSGFKSAVIWCKAFSVQFASAPLS